MSVVDVEGGSCCGVWRSIVMQPDSAMNGAQFTLILDNGRTPAAHSKTRRGECIIFVSGPPGWTRTPGDFECKCAEDGG